MDDKSIVELYFKRDERAIFETSQKYGKYCYSIAYRILNSHEDAEESVNDMLNGAWNNIPPHRPSNLSTFLGKITRRISVDRFRHRTAEKRGGGDMSLVLDELENCISGENDIDDSLEKERLASVINDFVLSLPENEQRVFVCRY